MKFVFCRIFFIGFFAFILSFGNLYAALFPPPISSSGSLNTPPLVIGTLPFNPPFETSDANSGVFLGFEIDMMNSICNRMGAKCVFKAIPEYQQIFAALDTGKIDMTVASIVIIEGSASYLFSYPFLPSYVQFFAKNNSTIETAKQVVGRKIGMINDPLLQAVMLQKFGSKPPFVIFPSVQAGIDSLTQGNIDVMVLEARSVDYWLSNTGGIFKKVGEPLPFGLGYGVMTRNTRLELINEINKAILSMENDGTYVRIYNRYFNL